MYLSEAEQRELKGRKMTKADLKTAAENLERAGFIIELLGDQLSYNRVDDLTQDIYALQTRVEEETRVLYHNNVIKAK